MMMCTCIGLCRNAGPVLGSFGESSCCMYKGLVLELVCNMRADDTVRCCWVATSDKIILQELLW